MMAAISQLVMPFYSIVTIAINRHLGDSTSLSRDVVTIVSIAHPSPKSVNIIFNVICSTYEHYQ